MATGLSNRPRCAKFYSNIWKRRIFLLSLALPKILSLEKSQINLDFYSLIRIFANGKGYRDLLDLVK